MLIKLFARGTGGGKGPVEYCIAHQVAAFDLETRLRIPGQFKTRNPPPEILGGDPERTIMLIDASDNKWRYTSGVIAFEISDDPSSEEQIAVMTDFELMAFSGLERDQYDILWTRHVHEGNVELHFVVPRLELASGKALNIAPPGYMKTFDYFRDSWNWEKGWARPDDPARARLVRQDDHFIKTDAARISAGLSKVDDPKLEMTRWLTDRIVAGLVTDRAGIVSSLCEIGQITREGKDYVSVKPKGFEKAIRLKGAIYHEKFDARQFLAEFGRMAGHEAGGGQDEGRRIDPERAKTARAKLSEAVSRRARFNQERYRKSIGGHGYSHVWKEGQGGEKQGRGLARSIEPCFENTGRVRKSADEDGGRNSEADQAHVVAFANSGSGNPVALPADLASDLGLDANGTFQREHRDSHLPEGTIFGDNGPKLDSLPTGEGQSMAAVQDDRAGGSLNLLDFIKSIVGGLYDRAGTAIGQCLGGTWQAIRNGFFAAGKSERKIAATSAELGSAGAKFEQFARKFDRHADRACGVMKMKREDELRRFKTEINLVEFAESLGYEIDRRESSRASVVMRQGDEKIIVATDSDGHGIYFSIGNVLDCGSIIDFIQNRRSLNLGQVRKALRPWISSLQVKLLRQHGDLRPRKPDPSNADRQQVLLDWLKMQLIHGRHPYLEDERKLSQVTLADPRFSGMVRIDARGNAVFPHYDEQGLSGYEIKNDGFTGFATGGTKAIWHSSNLKDAPKVIIVESAIDAMSHAELSGDRDAGYISVGGSMSESQCGLLRDLFAKLSTEIIVATDNDAGGHHIAEQVGELLPAGVSMARQVPESGKGWNEVLKAKRAINHMLSV